MRIKITIFTLFLTFLTNAQVLINETFPTQVPPTGWTLQSTASGTNTWSYFASGAGAALFHSGTNQQNEWLITPTLNLTNLTNCYLQFILRLTTQETMITLNEADLFVKISTDGGNNWTNIWNDGQYNFPAFSERIGIDLSQYVGNANVKVAFQYVNNIPGTTTNIVQLYEVYIASCPKPSVILTNQYPSLASWTLPFSFNGTFDIEYGPTGFTQSTGTLITGITENSHLIPNMNCQHIDYFVRANCGGTMGAWSNRLSRPLITFLTADLNQVTATSANLSWTGVSGNYTLEYGPLNFEIGTGTTISNISGFSQVLTNLSPCTNYTVRVKVACDENNTWIGHSFKTSFESMSPLVPTFSENFDNTTLCDIGYWRNNPFNEIEMNSMRVTNTGLNSRVESRRFQLTAGNPVNVQIQARKLIENAVIVTNGIIKLKRENDADFVQNFEFNNLTTSFVNYSIDYTPLFTDTYYLSFEFNPNSANSTNAAIFYDNFVMTDLLSLNAFNHSNVAFYPNPTTSKINFTQDISNLEVFDTSGKKVKSFVNANTSFDVSDLNKGVYLIKGLTAEGLQVNQKLIKE